MAVFLHGVGVQSFRGIGNFQKLAPFKGFNFFIGSNNSGKSTILDLIHRFLPSSPGRKQKLTNLDTHQGASSGPPRLAYAVPAEVFQSRIQASLGNLWGQVHAHIQTLTNTLSDHGHIWISTSIPPTDEKDFVTDRATITRALQTGVWQRLWVTGSSYVGGGSLEGWVDNVLSRYLGAQQLVFPQVELIPAIREIGGKGEEFSDFSGRGLIDRLAQAQNPDVERRGERKIFDRNNTFLETVTGHAGAQIEIPHDRAHILVHMDQKTLPLSSLGTGIHEVIMIAAFCTLSDEKIVCIEEPELHLHPILQRKLVAYLNENTRNQYFIATHSASFIDTPGAAIFHVFNDGIETTITEALVQKQRVALCADLGYRASDIVQTNCVIWVEGPSDRIYLKHWLKHAAPDLVEGIHFSIMFYGGRLLNHLSADDDEVTEFISLRRLNQKLAVIMDSDREHSRQPINDTKKRIVSEFVGAPGVAWITKGREIENYIDHSILQAAIKQLYPSKYGRPLGGDSFAHALHFEKAKSPSGQRRRGDDGIEREIDKVKVARLVCEQPANLDILDLKKRIAEVVKLIRGANE